MTSPSLLSAVGQADLAHIERETRRFADVATRSPLGAHIPTYPAFTVETLAAHVGNTLRVFQVILSEGEYSDGQGVRAPTGDAAIDWVTAGLDPVILALREVPPERNVIFPHGVGEQTAAAVAGALAIEVGIHRWDVESVLGDHAPLPPDLAVGAIDKAFESYAARLAGEGVVPIGGTVDFHATDIGIGWSANVENGRLVAGRIEETSLPADTAVAASAEDLALLIWKRLPPPHPGVEVSGPVDILKRFLTIDYIPDPRTTPAH